MSVTIYFSTSVVRNYYEVLDNEGVIPAIKVLRMSGWPHMRLGLKECKYVSDILRSHRGFPQDFYSMKEDGIRYLGVTIQL